MTLVQTSSKSKNENKPELLVPLNNWKSLSPSSEVLQNADAVYFGIKANFSMRARAGNFAPDQVKTLVNKLHNHGIKAYLTTNILIYNIELPELYQTIELAKSAEVDAVICHDVATIMICKQIGIPFHVSTQANISNRISAKYYESLGAERIILARELSLEEIKEIIKDITIPVEAFVHGAMCTAISGRCYFSAEVMKFNPEFSANRGKCVQPCRREYQVQLLGEEGEKVDYDLKTGLFFNAKDLSMIGHIPELIQAGIASFKIEGRMRDPEYIGETTRCYREAINAYNEGTYTSEKVLNWMKRLKAVFNRGFHTGFYFQRPTPDDVQLTKRGNVASIKRKMIGRVHNYYKKVQAVEINLTYGQIHIGSTLIIENEADFYYKFTITSLKIEDADVISTPEITGKNSLIIGLKVESTPSPIPKNAKVFLLEESD